MRAVGQTTTLTDKFSLKTSDEIIATSNRSSPDGIQC